MTGNYFYMTRLFIILFGLSIHIMTYAQNWDYVTSSGDYYFGEAMAASEEEADRQALAELSSMIAVHVSSDFSGDAVQVTSNGSVDHKEYVRQCINTYTSQALTNCERMVMGKEPKVTVRRWMKRSELSKVYALRIDKAKDMVDMAGEALKRNKVGIALQYYYWAYALLCSVQHPNDVRDSEGRVLVNWIIPQMRYVLSDVKVTIERKDGENVDLKFCYGDVPVSELEFNYNDGREQCVGKAKDGQGMMQMVSNFDGNYYHLDIEYEYKSLARADAEMQSVLNVISKAVLPEANHSIEIRNKEKVAQPIAEVVKAETQAIGKQSYEETMEKVLSAVRSHRHTDAYKYFTFEGREMFDKLIGYGNGRIVGVPQMKYYESSDNRTVARGLQMSFSFRNGTKTTFVEDVAFTFNTEGKIETVAFGLGKDAEHDILTKKTAWSHTMREQLMEFLESYKTAYCLKRLDYIKSIFADDAIIIVGNVAKVFDKQRTGDGGMTMKGRKIITHNRYSKDEYIDNLAKCFRNNEFINLRFGHSDIQKLEKASNKDVVCVQLAQDYNSTTYADFGYLFLMIDMSDKDAPFIKVRTWQPEPDPKFGWYNAGDFYDE